MYVDGSRVLEDVNDKMDWVQRRLGPRHPVSMHLAAVRFHGLAKAGRVVESGHRKIRVVEPDPDRALPLLDPVVTTEAATAADTMGHIYYRKLVDAYADLAVETRSRERGRHAQKQMLEMFRSHGVLGTVVQDIEQQLVRLDKGGPRLPEAAPAADNPAEKREAHKYGRRPLKRF
jgi:hypothetical protein